MPVGKKGPHGGTDPPEVTMAAYTPASSTASAAQTDFTIPWGYLRDSHLLVTVDSVANTDYTLVNNGFILRFDSAMAGGEAVVISRQTPIDERLVDFVDGGGLSEDELDEAFNQLFFALEEYNYLTGAADLSAYVTSAQTAAGTATTQAAAAAASASTATTQASAAAASAALAAQLHTGWIKGFILSRGSATTVGVGAGACVSEDGSETIMRLAAGVTIDITTGSAATPVALGLGANRATSTWYHVFIIEKDSDGSISAYADTSISAAGIPSGYTAYRRVGSFKLNATGSGEVVPFVQHKDYFLHTDPANLPLDYSNTAQNYTTGLTITLLNVPPDVRVLADLRYHINAQTNQKIFQGGDETSTAPATTAAAPLADYHNSAAVAGIEKGRVKLLTNTSKQIKYRTETDTSSDLHLLVVGYEDARGA